MPRKPRHGFLLVLKTEIVMSSIKLKPYKFLKYRGSKIYLFKTRNQKFIKSTYYSNELADNLGGNLPDYPHQVKVEPPARSTRLGMPDIINKDINQLYIYSSQYEFKSLESTFCWDLDLKSESFPLSKKKVEPRELEAINFRRTEEETITIAKKSVDRIVGDFAFFKENNIATHVYDRLTGKVAPRWCSLVAAPYRIRQEADGCNVIEVTPYSQWEHKYAINYEGYGAASKDLIPYVYINNCLIVTQYRELEGWSIAEPLGVTMSLLKEVTKNSQAFL